MNTARHPLYLALRGAFAALALLVAARGQDASDSGEIVVSAHRLDIARNGLSPETGSSVYRFGEGDIAALPQGSSTALDQVLLQAPGVVQDSFGQLHVRGDHANVQYRLNGIVLPEAISGFGQVLDAAFIHQVNFLTGALPAQYGYRTAGVVDIRAKSGAAPGGEISLYGGSHGRAEVEANAGGGNETLQYFVDASAGRDGLGIESPTAASQPLHDRTEQQRGFAYLAYALRPDTRLSLIAGGWQGRFQIPNASGQQPVFTLHGAAAPDSATLDASQHEQNRYAIVALQGSPFEGFDYQLALFNRYTDVHYRPDPVGDLVYDGIAADVLRSNRSSGLQADMSRTLGAAHTLRAGLFYSQERSATTNRSLVFPADDSGAQTSDLPIAIDDDGSKLGRLYGAYAQDEWHPTGSLTVNYGVRFDRVNAYVDERQWSPRLGLSWQIDAATTLHAGVSRYFTPPPTEKIQQTSVDKFLGTTNALPSDANTAVSAERSTYYDLGLSHQWQGGWTLGLDGYYRDVRNLQDEGQFGNALIFSPFNYARGRVYGLEATIGARQGNWSGYLNASLSRAEGRQIVSGQYNFEQDELDYIASHWVHLDHDQTLAASGGLSYQAGEWRYSVTALYGSGLRRGFANADHLPSYTQVDLGLTRAWQMADMGKLEGRLAVVNLFDRSYLLRDGSGIGVGAPQYGPRRAVYAGLSQSF